MPTKRQALGEYGERVAQRVASCPRCKRRETLVRLPPNFKCADLICDFCGFLAQVKSVTVKDVEVLPKSILGAAWGPQKARMEAGIYFSLYIVLVNPEPLQNAVYFLPAELQEPSMFVPRAPLSPTARRAGWQGYLLVLGDLVGRATRVA